MVSVAKIGKKYKHGFTTRKEYSKIQSSQNKGKETSYILPDTTYLCLNKCFNEINPTFNTNYIIQTSSILLIYLLKMREIESVFHF